MRDFGNIIEIGEHNKHLLYDSSFNEALSTVDVMPLIEYLMGRYILIYSKSEKTECVYINAPYIFNYKHKPNKKTLLLVNKVGSGDKYYRVYRHYLTDKEEESIMINLREDKFKRLLNVTH